MRDIQEQTVRVIVFAKAPEPGHVKTRLAVAIGNQAAAALASRMLGHALEQARAAGIGALELCCAPDMRDSRLMRAAGEVGAQLSEQGEGDLGQRMARAAERALHDVDAVLVIGTDCPALDAARLREAARRLMQDYDAVFFPALDGGYVLIGLRRLDPALFEGIPWSTGSVMAETRSRLRALGYRWWEGPPLQDIDEPADLVHAPPHWTKLPV
jgi:uncharacterized protein